MKDIFLDLHQNLTIPEISRRINVLDWFEMVRSSKFSSIVTLAREGSVDKESAKSFMVPCVTYNFSYDGYKKDDLITGSTGLLYIDVDKSGVELSPEIKSKVYCAYKSFGGEGLSIIVRVEGLNTSNFSTIYNHIIQDLNLDTFVDNRAIKKSQYAVLSFDKDIYINQNPYVYYSTDIIYSNNINNKKVSTSSIYIKKRLPLVDTFSDSITLSDFNLQVSNIEFEGDLFIDFGRKGLEYTRVFVPKDVQEGSRNTVLSTTLSTLKGLNPNISRDDLKNFAYYVNNKSFVESLGRDEIEVIIDKVHRKSGEHCPTSRRRIVFNPDYDLTPLQRRSIAASHLNKCRSDENSQKIKSFIQSYTGDKKLTQKFIAESTGLSIATVKRRSKLIKKLKDEK